jgi:hypothetical protein
MKAAALLVSCICVLSCAGVPRITRAGAPEAAVLARECMAPFLKGKWRIVHSMQGTFPGGSTADMIGVTIASADTGTLHSTLMAIEGLVLLDAEYDGSLVINRGIGPLAQPDLVMGMMRDIRLMLFVPPGTLAEAGVLEDGNRACRYRSDDGDVFIITKASGDVELRAYDRSSRLLRTVRFMGIRPGGIPKKIELESAGMIGYSLRLDLIEADRVR